MQLDSSWNTSNGIDFEKTIALHKCTSKDRESMYQSDSNYAGQIDLIFPKMFCIDPAEIELQGNFNTDYSKRIKISLEICDRKDKKKPCKDINDLNENWPELITIFNTQRY